MRAFHTSSQTGSPAKTDLRVLLLGKGRRNCTVRSNFKRNKPFLMCSGPNNQPDLLWTQAKFNLSTSRHVQHPDSTPVASTGCYVLLNA